MRGRGGARGRERGREVWDSERDSEEHGGLTLGMLAKIGCYLVFAAKRARQHSAKGGYPFYALRNS